MSEGKPTGSDQSTSNGGGGGGKTVDSGGGGGTMDSGGDGGTPTADSGGSGGNVDSGGGGGTLDSGGGGGTLDSGGGGGTLDSGGGGGTVDSGGGGETVDSGGGGETVDSGGGGGTVDSGGGGETVDSGGGGGTVDSGGGGGTLDSGGSGGSVDSGGGGETLDNGQGDGTTKIVGDGESADACGNGRETNGDGTTDSGDDGGTMIAHVCSKPLKNGVPNRDDDDSSWVNVDSSEEASKRQADSDDEWVDVPQAPMHSTPTDVVEARTEMPGMHTEPDKTTKEVESFVEIGLQVKVNDEEAHQSFEYKWALIQQTPQSLDWTPVTKNDVTYDHVRCHQLQTGDNLPFLLADLASSPGTKALILINTENSCVVRSSFLPKDQVSIFPVLIITHESGDVLTFLLEKNEPGAVKVKIHCPTVSSQTLESEIEESEETSEVSLSDIKPQIVPQKLPDKQPNQPEITYTAKQANYKQQEPSEIEVRDDTDFKNLDANENYEDAQEIFDYAEESDQRRQIKADSSDVSKQGSVSTLTSSEPIINGLQIRVKGELLFNLTYAWSSVTEAPHKIGWIDIRKNESTSPHIRCYWLDDQKEEEIPTLMANILESSSTAALLLVNTKNHFEIETKFISPNEKCGFPVAVVTHEVGQTLNDVLEKHGRDVQAKLEIVSVTKNVQATEIKQIQEEQLQEPQGIQKAAQFFGFAKWLPGMKHSKPVVELAATVQNLLFPSDHQVKIASASNELFVDVMAEFTKFENEGGDQTEANKTLSMLLEKSQISFQQDFPFYLTVAYRAILKPPLYECETYLKMCIDRMESMDVAHIANTLKVFFRSGDFNIPVNYMTSTEASVIWFTREAVYQLMIKRKPIPPLRLYPAMLWITIYLKLNSFSSVHEVEENAWFQLFLKDSHLYGLDAENLEGTKSAILLGAQLELPQHISFNTRCIGELLAPSNGNKTRPLCHQRNAVYVFLPFFTNEENFAKFVVIKLREFYEVRFMKRTRGYVNSLSSSGTRLGAVKEVNKLADEVNKLADEGLELLDAMNEVYSQRKWRMECFDDECKKWLLLLLRLVDYEQNPEVMLNEFISSEHYVVAQRHQRVIISQVVERTREKLRKFPVHQFFVLYRDFQIWPDQLLDEYLDSTPKSVTLSDPTWVVFFGETTKRLPGASNQKCVHRFLFQIAEHYKEQRKAIDFVVDLLEIDVPELFAVRMTVSGDEVQKDKGAVSDFKRELQMFIIQNALKHKLLSNLREILKRLTDKCGEFHRIILSAILKEISPRPKDLQGTKLQPSWNHAVDAAVNCLKAAFTWIQKKPSFRQTFCLQFVNTCFSRIQADSSTFDWVEEYSTIIHQLGEIYCSYAGKTKQTIPSDVLPQSVSRNPSTEVKDYFLQIQKIQQILTQWKTKLDNNDANYDEIYMYIQKWRYIHDIAQHVSASDVVISPGNLKDIKKAFLEKFEDLNILLLKYVPGDSKPGWCSLLSVLSGHGVALPTDISTFISENVLFPREQNPIIQLVKQNPSPSVTRKFSPPDRSVKLQLSKTVSLTVLNSLTKGINGFINPVAQYVNILVYFNLRPNKVFSTYLNKEVDCQVHTQQLAQEQEEHARLPVTISLLQNALQHTVALIENVMKGDATYRQIVAGGLLDLQFDGSPKKFADINFDVEEEFQGLVECPLIRSYGARGLYMIKSLLKLLQLPHYFEMINCVCSQYHLGKCQEDLDFKKISEWAIELQQEDKRASLTPADAESKWKEVQEIFCLQEGHSLKCLDLFAKIADSVDFYHFLEEKQFTGQRGELLFRQQYDLVTAQLQHEEYNETVLNHLYAAFKFISPFTDSEQTFSCLMKAVTSLDTAEGLVQLDTVKNNMHLIRLWFSRAEDTLENVSHELKYIFETGNYHFVCTTSDGRNSIQLRLDYQAESATKRQPRVLRQDSTSAGLMLDEVEPELEGTSQPDKTETQQMVLEQWGSEQITDFVRKLGFVESKEDEDQIHHFIVLNETAHNLCDIYVKLKDLGLQKYLDQKFEDKLKCPVPVFAVENEVLDARDVLKTWISEVEQLHNSNKWLLFFRIPKLLLLYKVLTYESCDVTRIHQEIGFLFQRDVTSRQELNKALQHTTKIVRWKPAGNDVSPMEAVGSFLTNLFQVLNRQTFSQLPKRYNDDLAEFSHSPTTPLSPHPEEEFVNVLHSALGFTQGELIGLILRIYGGPPEPFELLHCTSSTTEDDVKLFMKRIHQHSRQYLVLEVNHLPFQLQEVLLQLYLEFRHKQHSRVLHSSHETTIHFIETAPSVLREIPWLRLIEHKNEELLQQSVGRRVLEICNRTMNLQTNDDIGCLQLVYGLPGDGKTHYITEQLKGIPQPQQVIIAVNEAFTYMTAIEKLCSLPSDKIGCAIFFNFTILPPVDSKPDIKNPYHELINEVGWFFFDLLVLGYVEDPSSGKSFHFPANLSWKLFIEVPSRTITGDPHENLELFKTEVPVLNLLGTPVPIEHTSKFSITGDVQLVCKYLKALETKRIDKLYREHRPLVKFSTDPELAEEECQRLLHYYMPDHIKENKITQKLFIHYMERRCRFLDNMPAFNYNTGVGEYVQTGAKSYRTDTKKLGSTLLETMLKEVADFCDPKIKESWTQKGHQQLIYDFKDGGGSLGLISLLPDEIPEEDKSKFLKIGVEIPSMKDLYSRQKLDEYLSRALNVPLAKRRLTPIDEQNYVLTLDFTLKMLNIHERYECGIPVIIEGETGVGKTALIGMLSKLWSHSWVAQWEISKDRILDIIKRKLGDNSMDAVEVKSHELCMDTVHDLGAGKVSEAGLDAIAQLPHGPGNEMFCTKLNEILLKLEGDPIFSMLELQLNPEETLPDLFKAIKAEISEHPSPQATAHLLYVIFTAKVRNVFYKLNVHAALKPKHLKSFFEPVFKQAEDLQQAYASCDPTEKPNFRVPFVTVYLDEINTCSCLGLFKEIITDRTLDGKAIPTNVFIIAACNPHRGDSLAVRGETSGDTESWLKGTYYVHKLHPTLQFLMWDYGSLNQHQELEYVHAKMAMLNKQMSDPDVQSLAELIVESQNKMRKYAFQQLCELKVPGSLAMLCAKSSVSQRDIQRVFTFYQWLMKLYNKFNPHEEKPIKFHRRAVLVALGVVYFMRLTSKFRSDYRAFLDSVDRMEGEVTFSQAYINELRWFISHVELPTGIAETNALMENIFAIIACSVTHTPLIIVGPPGSSKTLSFNIVSANLKGKESRVEIFRETTIFQSLDSHFYQCSRRTTSNEIEKVFMRAINRQRSLAKIPLPVYCVVFMDEAGLPEEKLESLKVLHYHLDKQEVSFVAISNDILDASKTNRAVSLFRPKATESELHVLAKSCVFATDQHPLENDEKLVKAFCCSYDEILRDQDFKSLFGLRDFIHFVTYLRCKQKHYLNAQLVVESLERNFNGSERFAEICQIFLKKIGVEKEDVQFRSIFHIIKDSLEDRSSSDVNEVHASIQTEVRYKLIIDPSDDDSLVRLLFKYGVLKRDQTRVYICSDFPGDSHMRVNTISQIRHSVAAGHTILMSQTDEIHESFYDLFNQRFRRIEDPKHGTRFYANIAIGAHSKPCRVDPKFQCVVVVRESELHQTPAPFLNRFEKYRLTHKELLLTVKRCLAPCLCILLNTVYTKVNDFANNVLGKKASLYGFTDETLDSLMLTLLPPIGHEYQRIPLKQNADDEGMDIKVFLLKSLVDAIRENAGFNIPKYSADQLKSDADRLFDAILRDKEFSQLFSQINHGNALAVVDEALHVLFHGPHPNNKDALIAIYDDACLVIFIMVQWLVCYLCKRLLQLLTPEALIVHLNQIPKYYVQSYLQLQEHFSLKSLVEKQHKKLKESHWDMSACATKLLCFTRSSPLIRQLPLEFPSTLLTTQSVNNSNQLLKQYVFSDTGSMMMCKVSLQHSQSKLEKLLEDFVKSDRCLLLLTASMQEVTKKMVNHLRVIVEEAESRIENKTKLFVLLLHFPPAMFFNPCYSSLFLQGWDHYYLDSITPATLTKGADIRTVVDINEWFQRCCCSDYEASHCNDSMLTALQSMLEDAVPVIASRLDLKIGKKGSPIDASQRTNIIKDLLVNKHIGTVLSRRFAEYWTPETMLELLQKVTKFTHSRKSTLNITDALQTTFRALFFDFLAYMLAKINEHRYLNILLEKDSTPTNLLDLFLKLTQNVPVPDLKSLQVLSATVTLQAPNKSENIPKFPFFKYVCEAVDKYIDDSTEKVNRTAWTTFIREMTDQQDAEESITMVKYSLRCAAHLLQKKNKQSMEALYCEVVRSRIEESDNCVKVTVEAMQSDDTLWVRYFDDFARHKLHLLEITPLTRHILHLYIGIDTLNCEDALSKLVSLHVRLHVHHLDIAKVVRVLNPISKLESQGSPLKPDPTKTFALKSVVSPEHTVGRKRLPNISSFIVTMLFETFTEAVSTKSSDKLTEWHKSYLGIMSLSSMEEDIMGGLTLATEPQLNIMHATYLLMQCCSGSSADVARQFSSALHLKYFSEESLNKNMCPRLKEIAKMGLDLWLVEASAYPKNSQCVRSYLDGLFAFFFSEKRTEINIEDCRWFLEIANKHAASDITPAIAASDDTNPFINCASFNVFKLYLSRILGKADITKDPLFNPQAREMIIQVLMSQGVPGLPGPYIPTFYQLDKDLHICFSETSKNALMQQHLAHLYFVAVLEQLQTKAPKPNFLIRLASKIDEQCTSDTTPNPAKMLLFIEKQAVVQVFIQQLVESFFDPKNPKKIQDLFSTRLVTGVNALLDDKSTGGSSSDVSGHGLMFALHLQRKLKSTSKLIQLLQDEQSTLIKNIHCVKPLQTLIQDQPKDEAHLFPFLRPEESASELGAFYQQIRSLLVEVHNTQMEAQRNQKAINQLVSLAQESHSGSTKVQLKDGVFINKSNAFQMLMWLCAYYNFFCIKKNHSKFLADTIGTSLRGLLDNQVICLLQSFIYPKEMMIKRVENPPLLDENAQRFTVTEDFQVVPVQQQGVGNPRDPILELFSPPVASKEDQSDIGLRHAMANMVAAILACPPRSNHLWYHLFAANELNNTHVTGFMFEGKITKDRLYDCGVELSPDGTYGRPDYIPHATRGTLSLQSLYLLLWANFGAFCMALITQPDGHERISGPVISSWQHIRHYCVSQLRSLWWHMSNSLQLSTEEQSFFIMRSMLSLMEKVPQSFREGKFQSAQELDVYERMWHEHIFTACYSNIRDEYSTYCRVWQNTLLRDLRVLEVHFPHFPTEEEFSQSMLASVNLSNVTKNPHYVLSKFALVYPRLKAGGALLPDLIEFYQWIHTKLAYLVTYKYAQNHGLEEVITKADQKYEGLELCQLYERVKDGYNKYVEVVGSSIGAGACANVKRSGKIYKIDDTTKMLHFLSEENDVEGANDWLYTVIEDIINFHNEFLQDVFKAIASPEQAHVRRCFPEHMKECEMEEYVFPTEVNDDVCIVPKAEGSDGISEHLQLLRSRYFLPHEMKDSVFDVQKLQEDVIKTYLVGKPLIESPAKHLRMCFKFRVVRAETIAIGVSEADLELLSNYLKDDFKLLLEAKYKKALECEFHSADYHMLTEITSGLRNATEHLVKSLNLQDLPDGTGLLQQITLSEFLLTVFGKKKETEKEEKKLKIEVLKEIGMQSLSQPGYESQLACLQALKLPYLYSTLGLFVHWIQDGIYDFHHLPLVMKIHLEDRDVEALQKIIVNYENTPKALQGELNDFTNTLIHAESHMRKTIAENVQKSITTFLTELHFVVEDDEADLLLKMIPESVLCQNYVDLRLQLRRLTSVVQQKVSALKRGGSISESTWDELVSDIWEENGLKHLRDAATPFEYTEEFAYDPGKGTYAFQEGYEVTEEEDIFVFIDQRDNDELANQLTQTQPEQEELIQSETSPPEKTLETSQPSQSQLERMANTLTVDDITKFLKKIKLDQLVGLFSDNSVDGGLLMELSDGDLKDLGVDNGFHRRKIVSMFKKHLLELINK